MAVIQTINPKLFKIATEAETLAGEGASWDRCQQMIWVAMERNGIDSETSYFSHDRDEDEAGNEFEIINFDVF